MRNLVFIHGRSQEHKDAASLKSTWIQGLRNGLQKAGLSLGLDEQRIRFPYYGDTLIALIGARPQDAPEVVIMGPSGASDAQRQFAEAIIIEAAVALGLTDDQIRQYYESDTQEKGFLNSGWVRATMKALSALGAGSVALSLFTNDVFHYLRNTGVRDVIESGVLKSINPNEPTVVVSHSLGTIVSYNLLRREGAARGWDVTRHITLGCPLAIAAIKQTLAPLAFPKCVREWFNARDPRDMVALYPLTPPKFPLDTILNKNNVDNWTDNRHGIEGYLGDPEIAKWIHDAVTH